MEVGAIYWPDWGTLAVAIVALLQPWLGAAYRKWIRKPSVSIFPTGRIEVGYSDLGPTIGLHGSLKADREDAFIREIDLELVRVRDQATHRFEWQLFRQERAKLSEQLDPEMELAAGFMLTVSQPHRYNILFSDLQVQHEIRSELERVNGEWSSFVLDRLEDMGVEMETAGEVRSRMKRPLYEEFSQTEAHVQAWQAINRARYWEAGDYRLTMNVRTADPEQSFRRRWRFSLDESQEEMLSLNVLRVLQATCDQDPALTGNVSFAYADYEADSPQRLQAG